MLKFNVSGYLVPAKAIDSNISELEEEFVVNYSSADRSRLFEVYLQYSSDLKRLCEDIDLLQWMDGSFVTKRKPRPNDIDMVTFIDAQLVKKLGSKLEPFTYPFSKKNYPGIDAYIVEIHEDIENSIFKSDKAYWHHQFDTTRRNRTGNKLPKGFLKIIY